MPGAEGGGVLPGRPGAARGRTRGLVVMATGGGGRGDAGGGGR